MPVNSHSSTEAATKIMQSLLSAIPDVTENKITVAFVKDGTAAFNNLKQKFIITSEALENGHQTWLNAKVTVNHKVNEQGIISNTYYEKPFAYAEITGLSDEAMSIVQSPAYRGVSQESKVITSDKDGNVSEIMGTGITLVIFPEKPACDLKAGCGKLIASAMIGIDETDHVKYDVVIRNSTGDMIKTKDTWIYLDSDDMTDEDIVKERLASEMGYSGPGTYYIYEHNPDIPIGDRMPDTVDPIHTVTIVVSTESNLNINTDKSKLQSMSTRGTIMSENEPETGVPEALIKENDALKLKSMAHDSEVAAKDAEIADLKSQLVTIEKEKADLKSTIEKSTADMPTVIKSALEAHDAANAEKQAYATSVTELKSVMKEDPAAEFLKTEPNTAQIMSMVKALKSVNPGEVGVGAGGEPGDAITSMGNWDPVKKEWI